MGLEIKKLDYNINNKPILEKIDFKVGKGQFVGVIGPNGCGKSTLLKNIYRVYKPTAGCVFLDDNNVKNIKSKKFAKEIAVMSQENTIEFDMPVIDMILLGRYAHKNFLQGSTKEDKEIVEKVIKKVGLCGFENRSFLSLSGGEKQRVLLARALAQETEFIILDEPTNHLDIKYQYQIMNILKKENITVLTTVHDLNIATLYCDRIIAMKNGKVVADGAVDDVITEKLIYQLFEIDSIVERNERTGKLQVQFLPEL
ncbi:iron complex transport system ATP-binding protein [Lachnospiraceae bacterium C7]|nr:iron complex transport system ATP-binding protein [Lachnospiraceae bacterium C7]